jgi:hypothetical protein
MPEVVESSVTRRKNERKKIKVKKSHYSYLWPVKRTIKRILYQYDGAVVRIRFQYYRLHDSIA